MIAALGLGTVFALTVATPPSPPPPGALEPPLPAARDTARPEDKGDNLNYIAPAVIVPGINLLYWAPAKYIIRDYFADISYNTMRGNIRHGWVFDDDLFAINQIGHPYQGNSYFNAARSFGLSFWEAVPYTFLGSLTWEYLMESGSACCYPSVNDLLTTTIGGIAVGEVLWRLSNRVLDDSTSGSERFWREAAAFAINPPYGLYRLTTGDAFASGEGAAMALPLWGELSIGGSLFGSGSAEDFSIISRCRLRSGRVGDLPKRPQAFDHFNLELALGVSRDGISGITFDVTGLTGGKKFDLGGNENAVAGMAIDFDYFENVLVGFGQSGVGGLLAAQWMLDTDVSLFARAALLIGLGAITSAHQNVRNYNIGLGGAARFWVELQHQRWGEIYVKIDRYFIHTWSGATGDELAGVVDVGATVAVTPSVGIGLHYLLADKGGYYANLPNTHESLHLGEGYVAWRF